MIHGMKRIGIVSFIVLWCLISCQHQEDHVQTQSQPSQPGTVQATPPGVQQNPDSAGAASGATQTPANAFDPLSISQEERDTAKVEIQQLIQRLNSIIRAKNYNAWVSYLDSNYFAVISSKEYLYRTSQSPVLAKQKIVLRSAQDYFNHVVVPARTNDRVDDIEFETQNRVKAYTINAKGEKLRLYDLEKSGNEWKIIN